MQKKMESKPHQINQASSSQQGTSLEKGKTTKKTTFRIGNATNPRIKKPHPARAKRTYRGKKNEKAITRGPDVIPAEDIRRVRKKRKHTGLSLKKIWGKGVFP